ncbi:PaaI family thioesterase [Caulobacter sp. SL161]|uniref:PaaI family thioesterase n=1 Tax=Caulobacter sp. SL161 TaxID=2995156 RepID=UPI0022769CDA|nr:PaaI family thioesterase [Caulobacter sp. SL161]MCY1645896.1 PaaI family thioesterase [Caulobacter sp. SL161]
MSDAALPAGFGPHARKSPVTDPWEPLYARPAEDRLILATWVREPHCNSRHMPHGGFLAAMADNAMGLSLGMNLARAGAKVDGLVTVSLAIDYLGSAHLGQWLEFDTDFIKLGRSICFAEATVRADGVPVARARASFKVRTAKAAA